MLREREIRAPTPIARDDGTLLADAVGWSRRGIWPHRTRWGWACGADGRGSGFTLGATWTDASPVTENAILVGGRLHKIGTRVDLSYDAGGCSISAPATAQVELRAEAAVTRRLGRDTWPLGARIHWVAGRVHGRLQADDGAELVLDDAFGWAEDLRAR